MKDSYIKYGDKGMLITNYDEDDNIICQVPILYHKIFYCEKDIEFHENEYFTNLYYADLIDDAQDKISIISSDENVVIEHINKIEHLFTISIHSILGIEI